VKPPKYIVIHHTAVTDAVQKEIIERTHKGKFGSKSLYNSYILYHIMIGSDGTKVINRGLNERTGHTANNEVNRQSIAIVLNGNFNIQKPDRRQLSTLKKEIEKLRAIYGDLEVIPHGDASPTQCPGKHLKEWVKDMYPRENKKFVLSRYYTPIRHQPDYYRDYEGKELFNKAVEFKVIEYENDKYYHNNQGSLMLFRGVVGKTKQDVLDLLSTDNIQTYLIKRDTEYLADFKVNCFGDCLSPADGRGLYTKEDAYKVVACPAKYPFGTKFIINGSEFLCRDRGGMITENGDTIRLDLWAGEGMDGLNNIRNRSVPYDPNVEVILP